MSQKFLSNIAPAAADSFVASGTGHAPGVVPDPGSTAGSTRYLREDATWATPTAGTASAGGTTGQVQYNSASALAGFGSWDGTTLAVTGNIQVSAALKIPSPTTTFTIAGEDTDTAVAENCLKITNNTGSGSMLITNAGEVIFQGSEAFFGFADRTNGFVNASQGWGLYANVGVMSFYNESAGGAELSVSTGGLWALESVAYSHYTAAAPPPAKLFVHPTANATTVAVMVRGATSQSADLTQWQDPTGSTTLASVTSAGVFTGSGSGLTTLNGSNISTGTVAPARLGSGTPGSANYLRGDGTWAPARNLLVAATDGATVTFDLSATDRYSVTLAGNRTLALSNVTTGMSFTLILKQDATGSRTVTWFSGVSWPGGTVPTLTTTASKSDVFTFICTATGAYIGLTAGQAI